MRKKKSKAKIHKARIVKVETIEADKHLVAAEYEVHGPLPEFTGLADVPVEITSEAEPETP